MTEAAERKFEELVPVKPLDEALRDHRKEKMSDPARERGVKTPFSQDQERLRQIFKEHHFPVNDETVLNGYNPSMDITESTGTYKAVRFDISEKKLSSLTIFFKKTGNDWMIEPDLTLRLEDPFFIPQRIDGDIVFGGVSVTPKPENPEEHERFVTEFYRGKTVKDLHKFAEGPKNMKDIRIVRQQDGSIGIYTRPDTQKINRQIGYTRVTSLEEITPEIIEQAPLLPYRFPAGEYGGSNEIHEVKDEGKYQGWNFILGHRAKTGKDGARYYPFALLHDPKNQQRR